MPRLYAFIVCDKIIIDDAGTASLISLFDTVSANIPQGVTIPPNAVAPKEWAIFVAWDWRDEDEGREYTQLVELLYPDNSVFGKRNSVKFAMQRGKRHQIRAHSQGFPIGQVGSYAIKMWLEHNGAEIVPPQSIHINVQHTVAPQSQQSIIN